MFFTIIWGLSFGIGMILTIPFLLGLFAVRWIAGENTAAAYAHAVTGFWGRAVVLTTGAKVRIQGRDNLTKERNVCFVANHQSLFDVPLLLGWLDRPFGFIAKRELKKIPILSGWISALHSAFIDRSQARSALESFQKSIAVLRRGNALVLFPEGTRKPEETAGGFKAGSLRLPLQAGSVIQPITIKGTRQIYERQKLIKSGVSITMIIHPPITPDSSLYHDKVSLVTELERIILNKSGDADGLGTKEPA